jgi:histidinol-phosphate aminotransferase
MKNNFNLKKLTRSNVRKLQPYKSARDEFTDLDREMIFLDANENPFENGVNRYPDPQQGQLKSVLAQQKGVQPSQILLGNGSDEVLDLLYRAFCEPTKDNVITLPPTYGMYGVLASVNAVENREVLLTKDFELNVAEILQRQDEFSKLLFICSPNNPTGNIFKHEGISELLENFNGLVVIDEAYIDFSESSSWLTKLSEYPNLVVTQTLSKAYGMAGIRLGICYASPEIIATLTKIKPPYNVNQLTQQKAHSRLSDMSKIEDEISNITAERDRLFKALLKVKFIEKIYPSEANFILVRVDDAKKRYKQLLENDIVIRNRSSQPLCKNTLRLTIGTPKENNLLIRILKNLNS